MAQIAQVKRLFITKVKGTIIRIKGTCLIITKVNGTFIIIKGRSFESPRQIAQIHLPHCFSEDLRLRVTLDFLYVCSCS